MAEYIKRKDAINALWKALYEFEDRMEDTFIKDQNLNIDDWFIYRIHVQSCHADCVVAVNAIPSADVAEVRHGKWEEGLSYDYYSKGVLESKCSICGSWNLFDFNGYNCESNFCPNCGADMRGGT